MILPYPSKMRQSKKKKFSHFYLAIFPIMLVLIVGCTRDEIQLPKTLLSGQIAGIQWNYTVANGYLFSSNFQYSTRFLSDKEQVTDACTLPNPVLPHIHAVFRPSHGSFFVSPIILDDNQVQVSFEIDATHRLIATSGFMEIYSLENKVINGYLEAVLDQENIVKGIFVISLCN